MGSTNIKKVFGVFSQAEVLEKGRGDLTRGRGAADATLYSMAFLSAWDAHLLVCHSPLQLRLNEACKSRLTVTHSTLAFPAPITFQHTPSIYSCDGSCLPGPNPEVSAIGTRIWCLLPFGSQSYQRPSLSVCWEYIRTFSVSEIPA